DRLGACATAALLSSGKGVAEGLSIVGAPLPGTPNPPRGDVSHEPLTPGSVGQNAGEFVGVAGSRAIAAAHGPALISSTGWVRLPRIPPREVPGHGLSQVSVGGVDGVRAPTSEFGIQYGQVSGRMNQ